MFASNTSQVSSDAVFIEDTFACHLYTGNGSTQTITNGIDLAGEGGLVWIKNRAADWHALFDTANGVRRGLSTNATNALSPLAPAGSDLTAFNSNGFSLGTDYNEVVNTSSANFASWTFRKQPKFFDVVTYTGNGVNNRAISHSLGSEPGVIIIKMTTAANDWAVYHRSLGSGKWIRLNTTGAAATNSSAFPSVTSTTFTPTSDVTGFSMNDSGVGYVAYLFAHDAGGFGLTGTDNVISCGSYTGNGSNDGPVITLGYEPQWVMIKRTNSTGNWQMHDVMRDMSVTSYAQLQANLSNAESTGSGSGIQPQATGFKITFNGTDYNANGSTYIYIAIRRGPMKTPTSGTSVFAPALGQSGNPSYVTGFPVDFAMSEYRVNGANWTSSRLQGTNGMDTASTSAESSDGSTSWDWMNGHYIGGRTSQFISWAFRRAPGFFDEVCYTGTGSAGLNINHNLAVAPELMIVKSRKDPFNWNVYAQPLGNTKRLALNDPVGAQTSSSYWNNTTPTASVFTLGNLEEVNNNYAGTNLFVAYLFASCPGVSKVGSYTGTGTTQQINCGFTAGARFVLIKRTDSTGDWYVWDSARGIVAGNDPYLLLNSTAAEVTGTDYIDTYSAGFEISSTAPAAINASGGSFIYLAIA